MEEQVDILDSKTGKPTGEIRTKKDAHKYGLWHRAVHIWFVNSKNEILLQKRADTIESHPGEYDISAAGHLSAGDTNVECALREIEEELGIKLKKEDLVKIGETKQEGTQHNGIYINKEYNDIFIINKDISISDFILRESEVSLVKYITIEELKKWVEEKRPNLVPHPEEYKLLFDYLDKNKTNN